MSDNLGFVLRRNVMNATRYMNDLEFRQIITALFEYAVEGKVPVFAKPMLSAVFEMEKSAIDGIKEKRSRKVKCKGDYQVRIDDIISKEQEVF